MTTEPRRFGVYVHATFTVSAAGVATIWENPAGGYVVREVTPGLPYGRMTPVKIYKIRAAAERLADKLTFGT